MLEQQGAKIASLLRRGIETLKTIVENLFGAQGLRQCKFRRDSSRSQAARVRHLELN